MKTISIPAFGGPGQLKAMDLPQPRPAAGQVLVRLAYAGLNFIDVYMRSGQYARSQIYRTPLRMTLGMDGVLQRRQPETGDRPRVCARAGRGCAPLSGRPQLEGKVLLKI